MNTVHLQGGRQLADFDYGISRIKMVGCVLFFGALFFIPVNGGMDIRHGLGKLLYKLNIDQVIFQQILNWLCFGFVAIGIFCILVSFFSKPKKIFFDESNLHSPPSLLSNKIYTIRKSDILDVSKREVFGQITVAITHRSGKIEIPSSAFKKGKFSEFCETLDNWVKS